MNNEQLYDKVSAVLTDYEQGCDYDIVEEMYDTLVKVQNWMVENGHDR